MNKFLIFALFCIGMHASLHAMEGKDSAAQDMQDEVVVKQEAVTLNDLLAVLKNDKFCWFFNETTGEDEVEQVCESLQNTEEGEAVKSLLERMKSWFKKTEINSEDVKTATQLHDRLHAVRAAIQEGFAKHKTKMRKILKSKQFFSTKWGRRFRMVTMPVLLALAIQSPAIGALAALTGVVCLTNPRSWNRQELKIAGQIFIALMVAYGSLNLFKQDETAA